MPVISNEREKSLFLDACCPIWASPNHTPARTPRKKSLNAVILRRTDEVRRRISTVSVCNTSSRGLSLLLRAAQPFLFVSRRRAEFIPTPSGARLLALSFAVACHLRFLHPGRFYGTDRRGGISLRFGHPARQRVFCVPDGPAGRVSCVPNGFTERRVLSLPFSRRSRDSRFRSRLQRLVNSRKNSARIALL